MDYKSGVFKQVGGFVLQRLALSALTAFLVAVLVFALVRAIPGDPALFLLQLDSTPGQVEKVREQLGLNQPIIVQFFSWIGQLLHGNLGDSYLQGRPIADLIAPAIGNTLLLGVSAAVLAVIIGLVLGNLATSRFTVVRRAADLVEAIFLSAPQYTVALVFLVVFAVVIPIFPSGGLGGSDASAGDIALHLVLPATALALPFGGQLGRTLKTSIAGLQQSELVPSLRSRGLSRLSIALHLHHNALPPMVTVLGFQVGTLLGGTLFVETIFNINGLGHAIVAAVGVRDYQLVQGLTLVIAFIFILVILVADLVNLMLDPRMRSGRV